MCQCESFAGRRSKEGSGGISLPGSSDQEQDEQNILRLSNDDSNPCQCWLAVLKISCLPRGRSTEKGGTYAPMSNCVLLPFIE